MLIGVPSRALQTQRGQDSPVAVEELHLEAGILVGEGADAEPAFMFIAAHTVPCDQALGPIHFVDGAPQEGVAEPVQSRDQPWRQDHGAHGVRRERARHCI